MGRVIACRIPARAGQKAAEGDEPAEYHREQDTKKARRKRPSGIPQGTEQKRRNTGESRTKRKKNRWQTKSKIARMDTPIARRGRIIVNLLYIC